MLQLIGDTDATAPHVAAVALHRELVVAGLEVRTLALSPGRRGGLEHEVPAVAPSRRSFAARGQVLHESRWADVVVLHAPRALTVATVRSPRGVPVPLVVAFWDEPAAGTARSWSVEHRLVRGASLLVAPSDDIAAAVRSRHGLDAAPQVVPADLGDAGRPRPDGAAWAGLLCEVAL